MNFIKLHIFSKSLWILLIVANVTFLICLIVTIDKDATKYPIVWLALTSLIANLYILVINPKLKDSEEYALLRKVKKAELKKKLSELEKGLIIEKSTPESFAELNKVNKVVSNLIILSNVGFILYFFKRAFGLRESDQLFLLLVISILVANLYFLITQLKPLDTEEHELKVKVRKTKLKKRLSELQEMR